MSSNFQGFRGMKLLAGFIWAALLIGAPIVTAQQAASTVPAQAPQSAGSGRWRTAGTPSACGAFAGHILPNPNQASFLGRRRNRRGRRDQSDAGAR
jgi:hypothetical protein